MPTPDYGTRSESSPRLRSGSLEAEPVAGVCVWVRKNKGSRIGRGWSCAEYSGNSGYSVFWETQSWPEPHGMRGPLDHKFHHTIVPQSKEHQILELP